MLMIRMYYAGLVYANSILLNKWLIMREICHKTSHT